MPEPLVLALQAERYFVNDKLLVEAFDFNLVFKES
jgi:hypothetical protein